MLWSSFPTRIPRLTETKAFSKMQLFCIVFLLLISPTLQGRPTPQQGGNSEGLSPLEQGSESDGSVFESTVFIVGMTAGVLGFFAFSCAVCFCMFLSGRHGVPQTLSLTPSYHTRELPIFMSAPSVNNNTLHGGIYEERVSFVRTSLSKDESVQALETLELEKIAIGECLGRGAYGKVYKGEYAGIPLAIKVCEHDRAFLSNGNEPLETFLSRNVRHDNVVKTLVNETRRCRTNQTDALELSPLTLQRTASSETDITSTSEGGSDEFSNIARTMEKSSGEDVYRTWIIMEYCEMGSLDQAIKHRRFFTTESGNEPKIDFMILSAIDIADAMRYLHEHGIIHGDLKSQNVLLKKTSLDERGFYCKVGDFGLSRVIVNKTHIDTFTCGTVSHSAPELFRRGLLTPAADVYSFGILLWELVSGTKAFIGAPHNGIIMMVTSGCRPLMPSYCPQSLSSLINDCWQDSYSDRPTFKSISTRLREMVRDKTSFLSSESNSQTTSISVSATITRDFKNQTDLPSNEVSSDRSETGIIEDSTEKIEGYHGGMCPGRRISTVQHPTDWGLGEESEEESPQDGGIEDDYWHTTSELFTQFSPSTSRH